MTTDNLLPLGQKPEGELNSLLKMQNAFSKLVSSLKLLQENIDKLKEENKRLKDTLGILETMEPLVLTPDMEVKEEPMNAEAAHGLILTKDMEIKDGHQ